MIDYSSEIFNKVAKSLRSSYKGITVMGEYVEQPAKFPTVTIDEISNIPVHLDSGTENKYARVTLRSQVFCNGEGKRRKAREIMQTLDRQLMGTGFFIKTFVTTPAIYNSEVYCVTATHEAIVGSDGTIYRS